MADLPMKNGDVPSFFVCLPEGNHPAQRAIPWPGAFFGSATGGLLGFTSSAVVSAACGDIVGTE